MLLSHVSLRFCSLPWCTSTGPTGADCRRVKSNGYYVWNVGEPGCKMWMASYLSAVFTFVGPKKEVLSLRAFFKYCPDRTPPSTSPRQLWIKTKKQVLPIIVAQKILWFYFRGMREHLHLLWRRKGGPLRGWSASADELWGNTFGPRKSPHRQTCTHPRGPACDDKMTFIPRCERANGERWRGLTM